MDQPVHLKAHVGDQTRVMVVVGLMDLAQLTDHQHHLSQSELEYVAWEGGKIEQSLVELVVG